MTGPRAHRRKDGERVEAVHPLQLQVEHDGVEVGVIVEQPHRIIGAARLDDDRVVVTLAQQHLHAIPQDRVIVDDQNFHEDA